MKDEKVKFFFFYYWSSNLNPCPAKSLRDAGTTVGGDKAIKGAEWEITKEEYMNTPLHKLVEKYPWPFGDSNE